MILAVYDFGGSSMLYMNQPKGQENLFTGKMGVQPSDNHPRRRTVHAPKLGRCSSTNRARLSV